jgi:hypothetical protein
MNKLSEFQYNPKNCFKYWQYVKIGVLKWE